MNINNTISKIKEARKDALKERRYAEADGNSDYVFGMVMLVAWIKQYFFLNKKQKRKKLRKQAKKRKNSTNINYKLSQGQ